MGRARFCEGRLSTARCIPAIIAARYGKIANLADFVRKTQLANYEAFRAMYEGRNAKLFHPTTAVITWMSNPAQPSFVWQLYHYDLEPMSSLFAVMHAGEMVHIQFNEANGELQVINNLPEAVTDAGCACRDLQPGWHARLPARDESDGLPDGHQSGRVDFPATVSPVHFLKLELRDATGKPISSNFYWRARPTILTIYRAQSDAHGDA